MARSWIRTNDTGITSPKRNLLYEPSTRFKIPALPIELSSPYRWHTIANMPYARATPLISSPFLGMWRSDVTAQTGVVGFEPTHMGTKIPCLTIWRYPYSSAVMFYKRRLNSSHLQCIYPSFAALPYTATTSRSHLSWKWAGTR